MTLIWYSQHNRENLILFQKGTLHSPEIKHKNCAMLEESMKFGTQVLLKMGKSKGSGAKPNSA